jgi:hypothetical protein
VTPLTIHLLKKTDGSGVLRCTRADGSETWQRQERHAAFFGRHDLTHYAVETILGIDDAFFGLVARGWELGDFAPPWPRGALPPRALFVEVVVGFLDVERTANVRESAHDCNEAVTLYTQAHPVDTTGWFRLTDAQLDRIRARRAVLFERWFDVRPGDALTLPFPAAP